MIGPEIPEDIKRIRDVRLGRIGKISGENSRGSHSCDEPIVGSGLADEIQEQEIQSDSESDGSSSDIGPLPAGADADEEDEELRARERLSKNASQEVAETDNDGRNDWMAHALGFKNPGKRDNSGGSRSSAMHEPSKKHKSSGTDWTKVAVETKNPSLTLQTKSGNVTVDAANSIKGRFGK